MPRDARLVRALVDTLESRRLLTSSNVVTSSAFITSTGWTITGSFHTTTSSSTPNSGTGYAYLSGSDGTVANSVSLSGTLSQTVSIPAAASSAWLNFWYCITTQETTGTGDTMSLLVKNPTTGVTLATPVTINSGPSFPRDVYTQVAVDMSAYIGQSVTLSFSGQTNATLGTLTRIDDVVLQVETPGAAPALPAPTLVSPGTPTLAGLTSLNSALPQLRWNSVSGATGYGVLIEKLNTATGTYSPVANSEVGTFASPIKGTTFSPPYELVTGTYRWSVRSFDSAGKATAYAPALYFNLNATGYTRAVGVDISSFQTVSSWANIKNNGTTSTTADDTTFIYAKATEGFTFDDAAFAGFVTGARNAGIALGGYHFARPDNNTAASEAQHFFNRLTATGALTPGSNLVPMLDFEDPHANTVNQGKTALSQWANDFCAAFYNLSGIVPIIYTFVSYAKSYLDTSVLRYPLWQAQYPTSAANPTIPNTTSTDPSDVTPWMSNGWSIWQYTDSRTVSGFTGNVDADVANSDVNTFLSFFTLPSTATYTVAGTLFEDADGNGVRDGSEAGISGRTVYLDANGNGTLDSGERSAVTNSLGAYSFTGLLQGNYQIRQIVPGTSVATTAAVQSFKLATGVTNIAHDFGSRVIDSTPPTIADSRFDYDVAARTITVVFSEPVDATQLGTTATLANLTTGDNAVPFTVTYDAGTFTAVFTPTNALADGDYRLTLPAGAVTDTANNPIAASNVDFFWLTGDINRDRSVGFSDLVILAQNYNTGTTYAQGDLTGDGIVNFADLVILAQSYNHTLPTLIVAPPLLVTTSTKTTVATKTKKVAGDVLA